MYIDVTCPISLTDLPLEVWVFNIMKQHPFAWFATTKFFSTLAHEYMVKEPQYYSYYHKCFRKACKNGLEFIIKVYLSFPETNPSFHDNHALELAIQFHRTPVIKLLFSDSRLTLRESCRSLLLSVIEFDNLEVAKFLLSRPDMIIEATDEQFLSNCIVKSVDKTQLFALLLKDGRITPTTDLLMEAVIIDYPNIVRLLLNDSRINPSDLQSAAFNVAVKYGRFQIVRLFLRHHRAYNVQIYPETIHRVIKGDREDKFSSTLRLLIVDRRFNSAQLIPKFILIWAAFFGYIKLIKTLLTCHHTFDEHSKRCAIFWAVSNQEENVIKLLLTNDTTRVMTQHLIQQRQSRDNQKHVLS